MLRVKRKVINKVMRGDLSGMNVPFEKSKLRTELQGLKDLLAVPRSARRGYSTYASESKEIS